MNAPLEHVWGRSAAQDRVWAQAPGLAPGAAVGRLLMVASFQAFIDDSRSKDEFVLAGHIATSEAWATFAQQWENLLPLATKAKNGKWHFKMSEMAMSPTLMSHVPAFYKLIEEHVISSISCRMNMDVYRSAIARSERMAVGLPTSHPFYRVSVDPGIFRNPFRLLFRLPAQPVDATNALNLSAGVSNCKVSRGRSLS